MLPTLALAAVAAFAPSPPVEGRVVAASLFKNGFSVVVREVPLVDGETVVASPPVGVLGTVWLSATPGVKIQSAVFTSREESVGSQVGSLDQLLAVNVGRQLRIEVRRPDGSLQTITGKLVAATGQMFLMETGNTRTAGSMADVRMVYSDGGDLVYAVDRTVLRPVIRVRATAPPGGKLYTLALQSGLSWSPAYQVDISDERTLKLTARATIINDLSALDDVECRLITGFPNLPYLNHLDPFTSGATLAMFGQGMMGAGQMGGGGIGGPPGMAQNMMRPDADARTFTPFDTSDLQGLQLEDLFFYRQPGVTLKPGERGYYVLFQSEPTYRQVYTLDIGNRFVDGSFGADVPRPATGPDGRLLPLDVWSTLRFPNTAGLPFTTGVVTTIKDGELLGQDVLNYTSPGAEAVVRITKSLDIQAQDREVEVSRERGAITFERIPRFDLITVDGTIELTNRKDKAVEMRVEKTVVGTVASTNESGEVTRLPANLNSPNGLSRIVWRPTLQPGQTLPLTYRYAFYIPSR